MGQVLKKGMKVTFVSFQREPGKPQPIERKLGGERARQERETEGGSEALYFVDCCLEGKAPPTSQN